MSSTPSHDLGVPDEWEDAPAVRPDLETATLRAWKNSILRWRSRSPPRLPADTGEQQQVVVI